MYFTGRAGSILRYDTRSGGGGQVEGSRGGWNALAPTNARNEALAWRSSARPNLAVSTSNRGRNMGRRC